MMTVPVSEITRAFNSRFATKQYDPQRKISEEDFNLIIESARLSPSSFGFEPWNIIVVQEKALRDELLPNTWGAQGTLPTASHYVIITAKTGDNLGADSEHIKHILTDVKNMPEERQKGMLKVFQNFLENEFELQTPELRHQWGARQAYIALGNMMTVAALRGIDSQPIEGFHVGKVAETLAKRKLLDPNIDLPVVMASFGYRDMDITPKTRRPTREIVSWA